MSVKEHEAALRSYDEALAELYGRPVRALAESGGDASALSGVDESAVERALEASERAGETALSLVKGSDPEAAEVGDAQLAALAAQDLAIAVDFAQTEDEVSIQGVDSAFQEIRAEIESLLELKPASGLPVDQATARRVRGLAEDDGDPRAALVKTVDGAFDTVRDEVEEVIVAGGKGLLAAGVDEALEGLFGKLFEKLPDKAKLGLRLAVEWIKKAVKKLIDRLGDPAKKAIEQVRDWIKKNGLDAVLDFAYETKKLKAECAETIKNAGDGKDFAGAGEAVQKVVGKHGSQKKFVVTLFKVIGWVHKLFSKAWPAEATVGAGIVYGGGIAFAIVSGGDYVDWHRADGAEFLDGVDGIRTTLGNALA